MSLIYYSEEEYKDKEESIDKYKDLFIQYENNMPTLNESLNQLFISAGLNKDNSEDLIKDIINKCKKTIDNNFEKIKEKYNKIDKNDAYIICSYTCEAKDKRYSPYKILNQNLVEDNRKNGIMNISKYLYIFLKSLRKLTIYYPKTKKYLYRCLKDNVLQLKNQSKKWISYEEGNKKTFWGFTSTSPDINTSFEFLNGEQIKYGTIFLLGGDIWGYDITLFNYYKEEEILLEPERKYIIDAAYCVNNDVANITCRILKTPLVLDNNNLIENIYNEININENNNKIEYIINKCIVKIEMEIKINEQYKYISGIGFLCNIPTKNIKVLITYSNIIDSEFLNKQNKLIFFNNNNEKKEINMEITRYKNILKDINISIIEILDIDNINNFIEIDDYINSKDYNEEDIILIKFNKNKKHEYLKDKIIKIKDKYLPKSINEYKDSIILLNDNLKIIGIINNFEKHIILMNKIINKINFIKSVYEIKKDDIGKEIQILNNGYWYDNKFNKKNMEIENKVKVIINRDIEMNKFKHKFMKEGIYIVYYIIIDTLTDMSYMFRDCSSLKELNLSSFNTNNVTDMSNIFSDIYSSCKLQSRDNKILEEFKKSTGFCLIY